jgi:hypothetical protein
MAEGLVRIPHCIKPVHWPEKDRATWVAAHRRGGLLDDDGLAASWAPATSDIIAPRLWFLPSLSRPDQ